MLRYRIVSSLEKPFHEDSLAKFHRVTKFTALKNERMSFQILATLDEFNASYKRYKIVLNGDLAKYAKLYSVELIPSSMPVYTAEHDSNYVKTEPGLYPDLLIPLHTKQSMTLTSGQLRSCWVEFDFNGEVEAGVYSLSVEFHDFGTNELVESDTVEIKIINAELPEQELKVTQWFHCDCLADYYNIEIFSEKHWQIIESFVKTAVDHGQNILMTPTITPALDTEIGNERPTVQLVDIELNNGEYTFGFEKLDRFVKMAKRLGIKYFEIAPFFTQWGARNAPKVMATVDGEYKRIFGWDTDATSEEYVAFLRAYISALIKYMKSIGEDKNCMFHISDEPNTDCLEQYNAVKSSISDLLDGYYCMDALSNYDFYLKGVVDHPVVSTNHLKPFIDGKVEGLWCYTCCGQKIDVSNRFFAMPSARTRIIGTQMYKYNIAGYLQWGYNFYYNRFSLDLVNPFYESTGEYFVPSGDAYIVYPAPDGTPYASIRLKTFYEAICDMRAMKLCEKYYTHDQIVEEMEKVCGEIRFDKCPHTSEEMLAIRNKINEMIENKL